MGHNLGRAPQTIEKSSPKDPRGGNAPQAQEMYLGHIIGDGMLSINEARREELLRTPLPTTVKMLRKSLGAFSYVQRWIPGMAEWRYELLDKDGMKELTWTPETRAAFERLKEQVLNPPHCTYLILVDHLCW